MSTAPTMKAKDLFSLPESLKRFETYFQADAAPWEWVSSIKKALSEVDFATLPQRQDIPSGISITGDVYIAESVKLPPYARIEGPAWIGDNTEIRPGAYIRGNVIIGAGCVIGNACEYKNSLLLDGVQSPHYNYVGDSVLGNGSHLGAGVICSNLRLDQQTVEAYGPDSRLNTGMRKLGALLGDCAEVGCNSSLQPGTVLSRHAIVMPVMAFGGYLGEAQMAYEKPTHKIMRRPDMR